MDKKDLKIQALLEKITNLTTTYENQAADARVEITVLTNDVQRLENEVESLKVQIYEKDSDVSEE